jgi:predicted nuclease of predicted toxin-antitoxin system
MRFLVDECTGPVVAKWLREAGHDVFSVYEQARGLKDEAVIQKAYDESRILITNDKDFGAKVYRENYPHKGVIFMRLQNEIAKNKIATLDNLLSQYTDRLSGHFVVVTEDKVRFAGTIV